MLEQVLACHGSFPTTWFQLDLTLLPLVSLVVKATMHKTAVMPSLT